MLVGFATVSSKFRLRAQPGEEGAQGKERALKSDSRFGVNGSVGRLDVAFVIDRVECGQKGIRD